MQGVTQIPNIISFGVINIHSPQQNSGVFVGQINITGFDANIKYNQGHGPMYGIFNWSLNNVNHTFDGMELLDGVILDQDIKSQIASNF